MPKRARRRYNVKVRRVLSEGDILRQIADELEATPDQIHLIDFGNGKPEMVIPRSEPGLIPELRRLASIEDGHGEN